MLFALILVWVADIGAFFVGPALRAHASCANVSPGKTWEGVLGGAVASALVAVLGSYWFGIPLAAASCRLCLAVVAFSIVGDLTESLLKRFAGVKDSGSLFPGHGGVMDRIDSVTAAAPVLFFGLVLLGVHRVIGVAVLGSTGSIGESTLDVLARHPDRFRVVALRREQERGEARPAGHPVASGLRRARRRELASPS